MSETTTAQRSLRDGEDARRARLIAAVAGGAWLVFGIIHLWFGRLELAGVNGFAGLVCVVVWRLMAAGGVAISRGVRLAAGVSLLALTLTAAATGGLTSPVAPYIGLVPLVGAMVADPRESLLWLGGVLLIVAGLAAGATPSGPPRFPILAFDLAMLPVGVAACTFLIAKVWRRSADAHLATLEEWQVRSAEQAEKLKRALDEVAQLSEQKSQLLAVASHEIRGPLNGLLGSCHAIEETSLSDPQRQLLRSVRSSGESISHLLGDLLDLSRIEAGKLDIVEAPTSVSALLEDTVDSFASVAAQKGIGLYCIVPADLPDFVELDAGRIAQVLRNLVGNAVKFTERGQVVVTAFREGDDLLLGVSDTGAGIPEVAIARIFEPFEQVSARVSDRRLGTGLGLWISRNIVEASLGRLTVTSKEGEGSRFEARFPARLLRATRPTPVPELATAELFSASALTREAYETAGVRVGLRLLRAKSTETAALALFDLDTLSDAELGALSPRAGSRIVAGSVTQLRRLEAWAKRWNARILLHPVRSSRLVATLTAPDVAADHVEEVDQLAGRLLIVDDDALNRQIAARLARRLGLEVAEVDSATAALEALAAQHFDVALVDLNLADGSGVELALAVQRAIEMPPVLLGWTGSTLPEDREAMQRAGIQSVMTKPVALSEMTAQFRRALESRRPHRRSIRLPVLDTGTFNTLRRSLHSHDTFSRLTHEFLDEIPGRVAKLLAAVAANDLDGVELSAHAFASVAGTFGASLLQVRLQTLELSARAKKAAEIAPLVRDLEMVANDARRAIVEAMGAEVAT